MLDQTPVGWLPSEAQKKKWTSFIFFLSEAHLSINDDRISIIYYIGL